MNLLFGILFVSSLAEKIEYSQLAYGMLEGSRLVDKVSVGKCKSPMHRERSSVHFETFVQDSIELAKSCKWKTAVKSLEKFRTDRVIFNKAAEELSAFILTVLDRPGPAMKNDGVTIGQVLEYKLLSTSPYVVKFRFIGEEIMNRTEKSYPIAVFHGLSDCCCFNGMADLTRYLGKEANTVAKCIEIGDGPTASWLMGFPLQLEKACEALKKVQEFQDGVTLVGLSQGGLLVRALAQSCDVKVKVVVSIGGPQMGVSKMPVCETGYYCQIYQDAVDMGSYHKVPQFHIGPPGYYKDPLNYEKYVEKSGFLSVFNNEKSVNDTLTNNLLSIQKLVLIQFENDSITTPKSSQHFGFYANGSKQTLLPYNKTNDYVNDLIGLKTLNTQQKIVWETIPADHLQLSSEDLQRTVIPHLFR